MTLTVAAPVAGTALRLDRVPDPVFSQLMMGPGIAIDPRVECPDVLSPVDGVILSLHPHAFVVEAVDGRAILVHLGLDTIEMRGAGFTLHTQVGDVVAAGQRLMTWSPAAVQQAGYSPIVPVIALQAPAPGPTELVAAGQAVEAGAPLLDWA
ncbi:MAG: PTS glucose transporter subunit IIA [Bifidobacteriaceae bacterium]|jgi:PTS system N-acetylglucosamine-specific IIA component|nr:PTS glucose transporter subunit IIA [Bifidobacteriaceae bacterium]